VSGFETPTPMETGTPPPPAELPRNRLWSFLLGVGLGLVTGLGAGFFGNIFIALALKGPYEARFYIIGFGVLSTVGSLALVFLSKQRGLPQGFFTGMALGFMLCTACFGSVN